MGNKVSEVTYGDAMRYAERKNKFFAHLALYIIVNGILSLLNLMQYPDKLRTFGALIGWGIGLLFHGLFVFMPHILRTHPLVGRFLSHLFYVQLFNVFCAVVVTYLIRVSDSFFESLVFSICIGTLCECFIDGGRLLIWRESPPPKYSILLLLLVSVPVAYFLGSAAAIYLLDLPAQHVIANQARNSTALFILVIFASVSITWFFWTRIKMAELSARAEAEKARAAAIERQAMQAQLQLLQAQIEPHMLFNTLANLQGLIAVDPHRAQHMLDQLIQYLRATLSSSRAVKTTLAQEFSLMEAYLGLMSVRMGKRLSYTLQLPDAFQQTHIAPMLLQPLVENAIKHGLEPKIEGGHIDVEVRGDGSMLTLTVTDTGLGLNATATAQPGTSVGLANVRERLQALYGASASFSLLPNTPTGVIAQLTLPL